VVPVVPVPVVPVPVVPVPVVPVPVVAAAHAGARPAAGRRLPAYGPGERARPRSIRRQRKAKSSTTTVAFRLLTTISTWALVVPGGATSSATALSQPVVGAV